MAYNSRTPPPVLQRRQKTPALVPAASAHTKDPPTHPEVFAELYRSLYFRGVKSSRLTNNARLRPHFQRAVMNMDKRKANAPTDVFTPVSSLVRPATVNVKRQKHAVSVARVDVLFGVLKEMSSPFLLQTPPCT